MISKLLDISPRIADPVDLRHIRLLSRMQLTLLLAIYAYMALRYIIDPEFQGFFVPLLVGTVPAIVSVWIARRGYYGSVASFTVLCFMASLVFISHISPGNHHLLFIIAAPVLISGMFLSLGLTIISAILGIASIVFCTLLTPHLEWSYSIKPLGMTMIFSAIVVLAKRHSDLAEADRRKHIIRVQDAAVFALAYQAEIHDYETGHHLERTARFVALIASKLQSHPDYRTYLHDAYVEDLMRASYLHDIGKVGIPDSILLKPGKLSAEEFTAIKRHCELGASVLRKAESRIGSLSFFTMAIQIALSHHERWDGVGYPHRVAGVEIPLSARIMALADVYDALRSRRSYKEPMDHERACSIIREDAAKQFDPEIVKTFNVCHDEFREISSEFSEQSAIVSADQSRHLRLSPIDVSSF